MAEINPYRPPTSHVEDVSTSATDGRNFIAGGRSVAASRGWAWIQEGWGFFKRQPGAWLLIVLLAGVIFIAVSLVPLLGLIVSSLLMPGFVAGIMYGCKALDGGDRLAVSHLFSGFQTRGGALLLLGLAAFVLYLITMIPMLVVLGGSFIALAGGDATALAGVGTGFLIAILLTLAISVPVYMAIWFAPALVTLHDIPPLMALQRSFMACLKNIVPFLLYGVILLALMMLGAIPVGIMAGLTAAMAGSYGAAAWIVVVIAALAMGFGMIVLLALIFASVYTAYREIFFED